MKVRVEKIANLEETEVVVRYPEESEETRRILSTLNMLTDRIIGHKDDRTYSLIPSDIYYFESVDNKVFAYTAKEIFETAYKLYELETLLERTVFLRVNKTTIINAGKIRHFQSAINGRMEAKLKNDEVIQVSRTYVSALKLFLGGKNL